MSLSPDNCMVLVCGGAGFVGSHLVRALLERGYFPHVADREQAPWNRLEPHKSRLTAHKLDLLAPNAVENLFAQNAYDLVINCSAYAVDYNQQDPVIAVRINAELPVRIHTCMKSTARLVHIGSAFEYGSHSRLIDEATPLNPTTLYGTTKAAGSMVLRNRARSGGAAVGIARPFGIWGPGEGAHKLVPQIIKACTENLPLDLTPCEQIRDYTYVGDMVKMILGYALCEQFSSTPIINLGSGPRVLRDFIAEIAQCLKGTSLLRFGALPYRPDEMMQVAADRSLFDTIVPHFERTAIADGVRRMITTSQSIMNGTNKS